MLFVIAFLPGAIILVAPLGAYIFMIISTNVIASIALTYIFVINGTVRLLKAIKSERKDVAVYSILMLVPIVNIFSTVKLNKKAKEELNSAGYEVSMIGIKLMKTIK